MKHTRHLVLRVADTACDRESRLNAFGQLVLRYQDMAYGYAYAILGDFHLAEDASQDAFVTAYRQLVSLRQPEAFAGWLRRIVRTSCMRLMRRRDTAAPLEAAMDVTSPTESPGRILEAKELRQQVLRAIRSLPEAEREVTTLFYINGYSQQEVADFLEVPVTTVNNRLHASRGRLKERMIHMVEDTLKHHAPDEGFRRRVMAELVKQGLSFNEGLGGFPVIETGQVRLREVRPEEDARQWLAVRSTEGGEVAWPDAELKELTNQLEGVRSRFYDDKYVIYWAIALTGDDRMIGNVRYWEYMGHWSCPWAFGTIQYELAPQYWHKGIAPAALRAAAEFGLIHLGFARVQCSIAVDDELRASELTQAGFINEGRLRCWWYDPGKKGWEDELMFSLVKSDLE